MPVANTVDQIITLVTEAPDRTIACDVLNVVSRKTLERIADQLYVDYEGRRKANIIKDIIDEARAGELQAKAEADMAEEKARQAQPEARVTLARKGHGAWLFVVSYGTGVNDDVMFIVRETNAGAWAVLAEETMADITRTMDGVLMSVIMEACEHSKEQVLFVTSAIDQPDDNPRDCPIFRIEGFHRYGRDGLCTECAKPTARNTDNGK